MMTNTTMCDLCHKAIQLTPSMLQEKKLVLELEGVEYNTYVTLLFCPHCGKSYPVVLDDWETNEILERLKWLYMRKRGYASKGKPCPSKLEMQIQRLNNKLDFKRRMLAEKFDGAFYQSEAGKERLDYRYHVR